MSRGVSWLILLTALCAFVALCLIVLLPMLVQSSIMRPELERWVSRGVGRSVSIQGPVRVSVVPAIKVTLSGLRVPATQGSPEKELVRVDSLEMEATWGHILRNGLRPRSLSVQGLHLVTQRDLEKNMDWIRSLGKGKEQQGPGAPHSEKHVSLKFGVPILGFLSGVGVQVSQAELVVMNRAHQKKGEIKAMSLSIGEPSTDGSQPVKAQGNVQGHPFLLQGSLKAASEEETPGRLLLVELEGQVGGKLRGSLKGRVRSLERDPEAHLQVHVDPFPLQPLLMAVGHDPRGSLLGRWSQVSFQGDVVITQGSLEIAQAELKLDESLINFSMAAGKGSGQALVLNLETEELDLNVFSQTSAHPKPKKRTPGAPSLKPKEHFEAFSGQGLPPVPSFPLAGSARIHKVALKSQAFEDLRVSYKLLGRVMELEEIRVGLEGGELWGSGSLNFHPTQPYVHLDLKTRNVQVGPVLQRLGRTVFLEGKMDSTWQLEGPWEGDLDRAALTWKGQADILIRDGSLNGVDLAKVSRSLGLAGDKREKQKARTPFSSLEAHVGLEDGSLKVSKASMQNKDLRILAAGRADLLEKSLDFRLEPELGAREEAQEGAVLVVPFWVNGSFSHPKFHPDLAGIRKRGEGKLHLSLPPAKDLKELFRNLLKGR